MPIPTPITLYSHKAPDAYPFDPDRVVTQLRTLHCVTFLQASAWRRAFIYLIDSVREGEVEELSVSELSGAGAFWTVFLIRHPDSGLWRGEFRVSPGGTAAFFALIPA